MKDAAVIEDAAVEAPVGELAGPQAELWRHWQASRDAATRARLAECYLPAVERLLDQSTRWMPKHVDVDSLRSAAYKGLLKAIDGFDVERGLRFSTYCGARVRGALLDELREQDWVPRLVRQRAGQIDRARESLENQLGRMPNQAEMAGEMGLDLRDYDSLFRKSEPQAVFALSALRGKDGDERSVNDLDCMRDGDADDPYEVAARRDLVELALSTLAPREREIMQLYYRESLTLKQVGERLGVTESRICQILTNVIKGLRAEFARRGLTLEG